MANTAGTYVVIALLFVTIFGSMSLLGSQALSSNENLDSDSIAEIANLDKDLNRTYSVDIAKGNLTILAIESGTGSLEGADPFEREFLISRGESQGTFDAIVSVKNIPDSVLDAMPFTDVSAWTLYLAVFGTFIGAFLFFAAYKFWKQGQADNG